MSGAVVTAVTKSGTNKFHGSVFEFVRNTAFNAYQWGSNPTAPNTPYHRNQFGGVIGGPIKRDKAFFLFSYGGLRQTVRQFLNGITVPSAAERLGDFTELKTPPPNFQGTYKPPALYFPGTTTTIAGTNSS